MNKKIIFAILVLVLVAFAFVILTRKVPTSYIVQGENESNIKVDNASQFRDEDWLIDNCNCIERNRLYCGFEGFELGKGDLCWKETTVTYPVRGCSKYNCTGENYSLVNETWKKD